MGKSYRVLLSKKISIIPFLILGMLGLPAILTSQAAFNNPESVVYDAPNNRYLVSNAGDGKIIQVNADLTRVVFNSEMSAVRGLHIVDGYLYAATNSGVAVFDLSSGQRSATITITGMGFLNDITSDGTYLYVTDTGASRIYRINISDHSYSTFVNSGITSPNGIFYDAPNNRLLIVSWMTNSSIQAVDINTAAVTTVTTTSYTNLDGITQDTEGYFYISSGASNAVYRYDSGFTSHSTVTTGTLDGPADIYFNTTTHNLAIPNFNSNSMTYVYIPPTGVAVHGSGIPTRFDLKQNYPNPFNPATMIEFDLPVEEMTAVRIYSALGREIVTLLNRQLHAGNHRVLWDGTDAHGRSVSTGVYFYNVVSGEYRATNKMILIR